MKIFFDFELNNRFFFSFLTQKELNNNGEYRKFLKEWKIKKQYVV